MPLKTKRSARTIAIGGDLAADLAAARLASNSAASGDLVFRRQDGTSYSPMAADRVLRKACKAAGIVPAPTWHDLRHSHVSMLFAAGRDPVAIAARIGDAVETVLGVYAHEYDAARRRGDESADLDAIYGSAMEADASNATRSSAVEPVADLAQARRSAVQRGS